MKNEKENFSIVRFNLYSTLLSIINSNKDNDTEFVIAKYLLENLGKLKHISVNDVAEECYVSRSSVQRFIKSVGYDSFTALKDNAVISTEHQTRFISYTDHNEYKNFLRKQLGVMSDKINQQAHDQELSKIARRIYESKNVVILTAEDSSSSIRVFQQSMMAMNKLVRIVTSASYSLDILDHLSEEDIVICCSASGNYALVIQNEMKSIHAYKALVTTNHTTMFEGVYDYIFYLDDDQSNSSRSNISLRNVYTQYGMTYFLDILYHYYFRIYSQG